MNRKRAHHLILLSLILFIFLYGISYTPEKVKINNNLGGTNNTIIYLKDNFIPLLTEPVNKNSGHKNLLHNFIFTFFKASIFCKLFIIVGLLPKSILYDIRQKIFELIPAYFHGSKYDPKAIFS